MNVFIHHVGAEGAERDFPRTVVTADGELVPWGFSDIEKHLTDLDSPTIEQLRTSLEGFTDKGFQIWGIPSGGNQALASLTEGDCMLLLGLDSP